MGLFEIIGERYNPGTYGNITSSNSSETNFNKTTLIIRTIASLGIIVGLYILFYGWTFSSKQIFIYLIIISLYSLVGYFIVPKPDYNNMGLFGGFIDHPFRYSDDFNRSLFFVMIFLFPGKFISKTVVGWLKLIIK